MKKTLDRTSVEKLYKAYILPIMEYASAIWSNCNREEADILETIHFEAVRIVTGGKKGTCHKTLYNELG